MAGELGAPQALSLGDESARRRGSEVGINISRIRWTQAEALEIGAV